MDPMRFSSLEFVFWMCICAVAYNYVGYPLVLFTFSVLSQAKSDLYFLLRRAGRRQSRPPEYTPRVAVIVSVYNEEVVILKKVRNSLDLDYPEEQMEILIGLDAPTDSTAEILSRVPSKRLRVVHFPERGGKLKVLSSLAE